MEVMTHASTFLLPPQPQSNRPALTYALVVLNQRLPRFTPLLWEHAQLRLCADGGANRVYDEMPELFPDQDALDVRHRYKPDVIKGDMDSIRTEVQEFYSNLGTKIVDESHDQDTTDLHKCIAYICDWTADLDKSDITVVDNLVDSPVEDNFKKRKVIKYKYGFPGGSTLCILVAGALGGRFDHEVGNINVLYRFSNIRIILLSDDCLIHLLPKSHRHEIHIQSSVEGPHCGLVPIGSPSASTTTIGLQWDLTDTEMQFGGLVSTSNLVREENITVRSDSDILWTISIRKPI